MKYHIELTSEQMRVLERCSELFMRLGMGQTWDLADMLCEEKLKDYDKDKEKEQKNIQMSDLIKTRKGIFIPDITVEMFRNGSLEAVEELLVSGEMQDIILPSEEPEIIRCKDCKWWVRKDICKDGSTATVCKIGRPTSEEGYCHHAERKKTLNEVRAEYGLPPVEKEEGEQE